MWLLVLLFIATPPGFSTEQVMQTFATQAECQQERDRIGYEMAESYPEEHTFNIVCRFQAVRTNPRRT